MKATISKDYGILQEDTASQARMIDELREETYRLGRDLKSLKQELNIPEFSTLKK